MGTITTKFDVGQTVFFAGTSIVGKRHACPDCLGSKRWKAASPAGGEFEVPCPRCSARYNSNDDLKLDFSAWAPNVVEITIARIDASTHNSRRFLGEDDRGPQYYSQVNGGSVYREDSLFLTREEAERVAEGRAKVQNLDATHWTAKQYDRTAEFSDYQLESAAIKSADMKRIRAQIDVENLLTDILDAETLDAAKRLIDRYQDSGTGYSRGVVQAARLLAKTARALIGEDDVPPAQLLAALEEWDTLMDRKPE